MSTQQQTAPKRRPAAMKVNGHNKAPPDAMAMLTEMHQQVQEMKDRIVRIETRQARQMIAQGLDTEGHPINPR